MKTPVTIIAGYLGAGKTTLINACLRTRGDRKIAIIVNDFGDINIDASLIEAKTDRLWSLAGGCVCCSIGSSLLETLDELNDRPAPFDHVLLETSGVAMPRPIAQSINLTTGFFTEAVWVLVDGLSILSLSRDHYVGDTLRGQMAQADVVLVTKLETKLETKAVTTLGPTRGDLSQQIEALHEVSVIESSLSAYHCDWVLGPTPVLARKTRALSPGLFRTASMSLAQDVFKSLSFEMQDPVDVPGLRKTLLALASGCPPIVLRAKGFLRDQTQPEQWLLLQLVGKNFMLTAVPDRDDQGRARVQSLALIGLRAPMSEHAHQLDRLAIDLGTSPL